MSNKNDSERTFRSLFNDGITFGCYFSTILEKSHLGELIKGKSKIERIKKENIDLWSNNLQVVFNDKPDLLLIQNGNVIGIEHFQVDDSINTDRGSSYLRKVNKIEENEYSFVKEHLDESSGVILPISYDLSTKNFQDNIKNTFNSHYSKIESYNKNIRKLIPMLSNDVTYYFFIECNNVFPFKISEISSKVLFSLPHKDITFLKWFISQKRVKGIFFSYNSGEKNNITDFFLIDDCNMSEYEDKINKGLLSFNEENRKIQQVISRVYIKK